MRSYSISEAARLLGVSAATVSRRLATERATRGRSAKLTVQEVTEIAVAIHVDPEAVRRRLDLTADFGPGMPAEAVEWATVAVERGLEAALRAHRARIPDDLLLPRQESEEAVEPVEPWGAVEDWKPLTSDARLSAVLPPLDR